MTTTAQEKKSVIIKFAGDSGDGMQLTGGLFTDDTAITGSDLATFPDFPAEIRAPVGTVAGVSGFQLHFGSQRIFTPGDRFDVLVAMNAAALKVNLKSVKKGGTVIVSEDGFDSKNLRLAKYPDEQNPLEDNTLEGYEVLKIQVTKMTREAIGDSTLGTKEKDRCKNMFVLGFLLWRYSRSLDTTLKFLNAKFKNKPEILDANVKALQAGYHLADTIELASDRYTVAPAELEKGSYRSINGNDGIVLGLIVASKKLGLPLFYGSYPITPASSILHGLSKHKNFGVRTFQAEDEIAAIASAIGASYGGNLGVTGTSGPGLALKGEALGLAVMLEMPLVVIDVQRGGPSTGLPTKTEQSDLLQALYGRNGECPVPVVSCSRPSDCFEAAAEACRIAVQHMTPVILLSDGYIANGAEPWRYPKASDMPEMKVEFAEQKEGGGQFMPYQRDEKLARPWAIPGTPGLLHRIGGIEKEDVTGNISYDPANHEHMVKTRERKVEMIANYIPPQKIESGHESGDVLLLGWGSTYGVCEAVTRSLTELGYKVGHAHLRYLRPFPANLEAMMRGFKTVVIPEINNGQLVKVIRDKFLLPAVPFNKIQGTPIAHEELFEFVLNLVDKG
ncbi:MAG: 2-oxoacid:acceptor oxidoreductase subunit alpha [Saprospiraceae bacterium]|jgi:2-oxoglutarate ferredoxin oxidoreductase subunit alpha|nr:2-oxoacid:acceptor oxidoreductase subunit alpha [Saprospiraceae bacterium]